MALKFVPVALGVLHIVAALPAITLQDLELADDTVSVGSYIREVRAAVSLSIHHCGNFCPSVGSVWKYCLYQLQFRLAYARIFLHKHILTNESLK